MGKSCCLNFPPVTWVGVCHYCIFPAFASHRQAYIRLPDPGAKPSVSTAGSATAAGNSNKNDKATSDCETPRLIKANALFRAK